MNLDSKKLAQAINRAHEETLAAAQDAVHAALQCGALLLFAQKFVPGKFKQWVNQNCVFTDRTAYNYMALVVRALPADRVSGLLASAQSGTFSPEMIADRELSVEGGKSLTQLYRELGIVRRAKIGGARPGAGRKRAGDADAAGADDPALAYALAHSAALRPVEELAKAIYTERALEKLRAEDVSALRGRLRSLVEACTEALQQRGYFET